MKIQIETLITRATENGELGTLYVLSFNTEKRHLGSYEITIGNKVVEKTMRKCLQFAKRKGVEKEVVSYILRIFRRAGI